MILATGRHLGKNEKLNESILLGIMWKQKKKKKMIFSECCLSECPNASQ
jgi:hypothetical protein